MEAKKRRRLPLLAASAAMSLALVATLTGCVQTSGGGSPAGKTLVYGTTAYSVEMDDAGLNPHSAYSGWSCVRYGVGETLFRFSDSMQPEPWLADSYEFVNDRTVKITLKEGIAFSSGRMLDGAAVKECLDDLVATHDRAPKDLKIANISAEGNTVVIECTEPCPSLINFLCDPYGAIIDMQEGVSETKSVVGTGPYVAESVSDTEIKLHKNVTYWNGDPKLDTVVVSSITDGDTLTSAMQSGEIQACNGLPNSSYQLFDNSKYTISNGNTSRVFFGQLNYNSPVLQDEAVRSAIAQGIDKRGYVDALLNGRGVVAKGMFPETMEFGSKDLKVPSFDKEAAKATLEAAGWVDSDGDGIREKDGQKLTLRWLTFPSRQELTLLAESAQATLGEIGFDVQVNSTSSHAEVRKDKAAWDVYSYSMVVAPTGDPDYFFSACCLDGSTKNYGGYRNDEVERLSAQLKSTFDPLERARIAAAMQQLIVDDNAFVFASFLETGIVTDAKVTGLKPHPCDYYEITADLDIK